MVAYQTQKLTVGVEAFQQTQKNFATLTPTAYTDIVAAGISVFARGPIVNNKLNFVVRYDSYNPDTKFKSSNTYAAGYNYFKESFFLAGLDFMPAKNVHIEPNLWYDAYSNKATAANNLPKNSNDMAARLTVYYIFR